MKITEEDLSAEEVKKATAVRSAVSKALNSKPFETDLCLSDGCLPVKYVQLRLPLKPENGTSIIQPVDVEIESNFSFSYAQNVECISPERGYAVANAINDTMRDLPIKCIYVQYGNYFEIIAAFQSPELIVPLINGLLCCLDYLTVLSDYMNGTATESEEDMAFETLAASGGYVNYEIFEDYNIVDS